jgi:hypothetical protein
MITAWICALRNGADAMVHGSISELSTMPAMGSNCDMPAQKAVRFGPDLGSDERMCRPVFLFVASALRARATGCSCGGALELGNGPWQVERTTEARYAVCAVMQSHRTSIAGFSA